ncbi:MAG: hypothetical protein R2764_07890 [Bacteroidales bacterium]
MQVPLLTGLTDQLNGGALFAANLVPGKIVLEVLFREPTMTCFLQCELGDLVTYSWLSITANGSGSVMGEGSTNVTVHFDATGLDYGVYTGNIEVSSNDPFDPIINVPCTLEVAAGTTVNLNAMLEGPFFSGQMTPWLNVYGVIPFNQPYNQAPWNYSGTESVASIPNNDIIDWVLVELRETRVMSQQLQVPQQFYNKPDSY